MSSPRPLIDWDNYPTAYGPRSDLDEVVRRLGTDDWKDAMSELANLIDHQGTVYPAAVPVSEHLLQKALDGSNPARQINSLYLIGRLVTGPGQPSNTVPDPVDAVRVLVRGQIDDIARLMSKANSQLVLAAIYVVSQFGESAVRRHKEALLALLENASPYVRGFAALALVREHLMDAREWATSSEDEAWRDAQLNVLNQIVRRNAGEHAPLAVAEAVDWAAAEALDAMGQSSAR